MADRYPLIANSETNRIEELASGDNLNLQDSGIVGATTITANEFIGNLDGISEFSNNLLDGANILSGTISSERLSGYYPIQVEFANSVEASKITFQNESTIAPGALSGTYNIDILGTAQTANFLQDAANINEGVISADRLTGVYNISITGTATSALSVSAGTYDIDITGISSYATISGYSTNAGISSYAAISGVSTYAETLNIGFSSTTPSVVYPTFSDGAGITSAFIDDRLTYIPSTNRLGINTISPEYNLDIRGDISFDGRLFVGSNPVGLGTTVGTLSSLSFIGVNTSGLQIGDLVVDSPQLRIFANTTITNIGNNTITITPNHLVVGTEVRTLLFSRPRRISAGTSDQVLVSRGDTLSPIWQSPGSIISVSVDQDTVNQNYNLVFTDQTSGVADLKVDSSDIKYNPTTNKLEVSGSIESPEFIGDLTGTASTAVNVIGGIASVTQLDVSGDSALNDVTAGIVTASVFFGDGVNLAGIVTQVTAGIGIDLTPSNGKGKVKIQAYKPTGKTIFVNQNGNDENTGLSENHAKRTIKAAASAAIFGDTIKVYPGVYVEENPIILKKTVSVEGTELRNCVVTPRYPYLDLFHVNNGCHITDLSFIGPDMTDGAAIVALQPLEGVAVDRYFDAARMVRLNLDYIANETVGFLTSGFSGFAGNHREQDAARLIDKNLDFIAAEAIGYLTSPSGLNFVVPAPGTSQDCEDDIRDIFRAVSYDLKANSNKKSVGAALSYFGPSGELLHLTGVGVSQATVSTLQYAVGVAQSVINNVTPPLSFSGESQVIDPSVIQVAGGCVAVATTISQLVGIVTSAIGIGNTSTLPAIRFGVTLESQDCADDIKDIWKCVIHDITRGGNSRCVDAGKAYYDDEWNLIPQILKNPGEVDQTVASVDYSFNVARAIINNVTWGGYPVGLGTSVSGATYDNVTGVTQITAPNHGLVKDDAVKIVGLAFTCPSGPGIVTYPSGSLGYIFNVLSVNDSNTFEVIVGQSTLPHTYLSGGTVQKYENFGHDYYQVKDLAMQKDPLTGFNNGINGCANVVSAMHSCVGIVTNIVGFGSEAFNVVGIRTTYPGNAGIGFTTTVGITSATYDEISGRTVIEATGINIKEGELIELRDLEFSCGSSGSISTQRFPSGAYGYQFYVDKINTNGTFEVYVGPSTLPHTYAGGGVVVDRTVAVTNAIYDNNTGITTITATGASIETGDLVTLRGLEFSCPSGSGTTTIYPTGNEGFNFRVLDIVVDKPFGITSAIYDNNTGLTTITAPNFSISKDSIIELRNLEFSCESGAGTTTIYPTGNNGYEFRVLDVSGSDFIVNVGPSTIAHNYVSGGVVIDRSLTANDTFTIQVGPSTIPHTYVSGGIIIPPYSPGVGPITQGPYIRNCTNFVPKSIGMKVDGFAAEPGDKDDIGVTGTMSVDSYTQYNQGGIGVSITNGAYSQLVSIFTICDDIAIFTGSGGQCDITNSNSSFGRLGLYSDGVGDAETKSIYRSTGVAVTTALEKTNEIVVSGVGSYRPYDGQICYFGELLFFVDTIEIVDGGSGYAIAPRITISTPEGPNGITAQATSVVENGRVTAINIVNSGTQYRKPPIITIAPPPNGGNTATARVGRMQPIYYKVDSATLPSAGISTISLLQNLNNTVSTGTTVYFSRVSLQITSSHSFEWVGSGNDINKAKPALGGVVVPDNEVVQENGGLVVYTSTDQAGNFKIGDGVVINQATGQISGRDFTKALFTTMTPFILALSE
jgi:phage tail protein X